MAPLIENRWAGYDSRPGHRIQTLRFHRSHLQTPILHYRHPDTGRCADVFGMHHFGPAEYFTDVLTQVEKVRVDGGVVLCEGSALYKLLADRKTKCTLEERAAMEEIAASAKSVDDSTAAAFGWINQGQIWPDERAEGWIRADMNMLEILRFVGVEAYLADLRAATETHTSVRSPRMSRVSYRMSCWVQSVSPPPFKPLYEEKNERTMAVLDSTTADAALPWGSAHLPTIDIGLAERGFILESFEWLTVGRMPGWGETIAVAIYNAVRHPLAVPRRALQLARQHQK